jgi:membrane associated rhomboid family serine protease
MGQRTRHFWKAFLISGVFTIVSTAAIIMSLKAPVSSPIQKLSAEMSYLGAPGAICGMLLSVLLTGGYGRNGTFVIAIAALVNLILYTIFAFIAIWLFRAFRT